jgi:hypothetical protein
VLVQADVAELITLYLFPTGRRLVVFEGMLVALDRDELAPEQREKEAPLRARVEAAVAHDQATYALEEQYYGSSSRAEHGPEARPLDQKIDRLLTAFDRTLEQNMRAFSKTSPIHQASRAVKNELIARGAAAITTLEYDQQSQVVQIMLNKASAAPLSETLKTAKVDAHIEELRGLHTEFKAELGLRRNGIGFDKVRAARAAGQRNFAKIVAWVLGHYLEDDESDTAARVRLLEAFVRESDEIAEEYARNGVVSDVDPNTGAPNGRTT